MESGLLDSRAYFEEFQGSNPQMNTEKLLYLCIFWFWILIMASNHQLYTFLNSTFCLSLLCIGVRSSTMGIGIVYPHGYSLSGDTLLHDTGCFRDISQRFCTFERHSTFNRRPRKAQRAPVNRYLQGVLYKYLITLC